jgi:hypothetical protein
MRDATANPERGTREPLKYEPQLRTGPSLGPVAHSPLTAIATIPRFVLLMPSPPGFLECTATPIRHSRTTKTALRAVDKAGLHGHFTVPSDAATDALCTCGPCTYDRSTGTFYTDTLRTDDRNREHDTGARLLALLAPQPPPRHRCLQPCRTVKLRFRAVSGRG